MDPIIYRKTHKRIRDLNQFEPGEETADPIGTLMSSAEAGNWHALFDANEDSDGGDDAVHDESYRIPLKRMILLSPNRKVPAAFLPSSVSSGELIISRDYTGSGDPRQCLPNVGEEHYGDMNLIYRVCRPAHGGQPAQPDAFYRYAYTDTMHIDAWYDVYHSLSDRHGFSNGDGTLVHDGVNPDSGLVHRQIDINIGTPTAHAGNVLALTSGTPRRLVHTLSQNANVDTAVPGPESTITFGGSFNTPTITVDSMGHTGGIVSQEYGFPDTPAENGNGGDIAGLIRIGTGSTSIGSQKSAGTTVIDSTHPYILVSAADHKHDMSSISFIDCNGNISYQGMTDVSGVGDITYDFNNILKARLPGTNDLFSDNVVLASTSATTSTPGSTEWNTIDYVLPNQTFTGTGTAAMLNERSPRSLGAFTNLASGYTYLVNLCIMVGVTNGAGSQQLAPLPSLHELQITVGDQVLKYTVPGTWTCAAWTSAPGTFMTKTLSCIICASGSRADIMGSLVGTDNTFDNVFTVACGATAVRLR